MGLWRGPALAEFRGSAWADTEAHRLDLLRIHAIHNRFEVMLAAGRHAASLGDLEDAVSEHPLDERLRALFALALYRSGMAATALRSLDELRRSLADELGISPGAEVADLQARILARDPALEAPSPPRDVNPVPSSRAGGQQGALPTGTVTFLFTDIEGSTAMVNRLGDVRYGDVLRSHRELIADAAAEHGGRVFGTEGDALFIVFPTAAGAAAGAIAAQRQLRCHEWPHDVEVRVRMGLHTGEALVIDGDYLGSSVHLAARVAAAAHGGQVVATSSSVSLDPSSTWVDLGLHRLKDVDRPQRLFQLTADGLPVVFPRLATAQNVPTNLPAPLDTFVGREREVAQTVELLRVHRLVTLLGPGGVGKTRLALEIARTSLADHPGGVFFVDLAAVAAHEDPSPAIAEALSITRRAGDDLADAVASALGEADALLLLDNAEHVLDAVAGPVAALLARCPPLRLLVTSREALQVRGERAVAVEPLGTQAPDGELSPAEQLFLVRAEAATGRPDATSDRALVRRVTIDLDGLPLAIELAASRLRSLALVDIARRLDDRFRLLTGGNRNDLERHQTLKAVIDWSHEALAPADRALFNRLSVFGDSFTVELAEAVVAGGIVERAQVLDGLTRLVDKSLVRLVGDAGGTRYRLLETLRHYGRARLAEAGDLESCERRLTDWAVDVAAGLERAMRTAQQDSAIRAAVLERGNIGTALALLLQREEWLPALRIVASVPVLAPSERLQLIDHLVPLVGDIQPEIIGRAWLAACNTAFERGDYHDGVVQARRAAEVFGSLGDRRSLAWCSFLEAFCTWGTGDVEAAHRAITSALTQFRALGETVGVANASWAALLLDADVEQADALSGEAEALLRDIDSPFALAHCLEASALTKLRLGRGSGVKHKLAEALRIFSSSQNEGCTAHCVEAIAAVVVEEAAAPEVIAELLGAAEQLRVRSGHTHRPWELGGHHAALTALAERLDPALLERSMERGRNHNVRSATSLGLRVLDHPTE